MPLFLDAAGALHAVFTERRADLRRHAGEISFPGGRRERRRRRPAAPPRCARRTRRSACRPTRVELLGALQPTPTFVTNYAIYPFVGLIEPGFAWVLAGGRGRPGARAAARRACAPATAAARLVRRGMPFRTDTYEVGGHLIWGATARIVADLLDRV